MRTLILANGDPPPIELLLQLIEENELFIATDGGANTARNFGVIPDIICGDFDSIEMEAARNAFPASEFVPTPDQYMADLEKAILLSAERGASSITILGASGGRIDHQLANHALLLKYARNGASISIREEFSEVWGVENAIEIESEIGDTISLIAMETVSGVSISGVEWPLNGVELHIGTLGVSNVANSAIVKASVKNGRLLVCRLRQNL